MKSLITRSTVFLLFALSIYSCRKQGSGWTVDALVPIADSRLDLQNIFEDSVFKPGNNNELTLVYSAEAIDFKLSDFTVPDTTIEETYPGPFISINWDKRTPLLSDTGGSKFDIDDANLTLVGIKGGEIEVAISSTIREDIRITYTMPDAIKDGQPLTVSKILPGAPSPSFPSKESATIDFTGYTLDLRGKDKNDYNTISYFFTVEFVDPFNPDTFYVYNSADVVTVEQTIKGLEPNYGEGVFLTQTLREDAVSDDTLDVFQNVKSGSMILDEARMAVHFENYIGADIQGVVNGLSTINSRINEEASLSGDIIGQTINLARARKDPQAEDPPSIPNRISLDINSNNSNLQELIEIFPDLLKYDLEFTVNPAGNTSGGNDFFYSDYGIKATVDLEVPLTFAAKDLVLVDTTEFSASDDGGEVQNITGGHIRVHCENWYPFSAEVQITLLDTDSNKLIDMFLPQSTLEAATTNAQGRVETPVKSVLSAPVDQEVLSRYYKAENAIVTLTFNTPDNEVKKVYANYFCGVKLVADINYNLQLR